MLHYKRRVTKIRIEFQNWIPKGISRQFTRKTAPQRANIRREKVVVAAAVRQW